MLPFLLIAGIYNCIKNISKGRRRRQYISSLQSFKFNKKKFVGDPTCSICMDDYRKGDDLIELPCQGHHKFHRYCIVEWLKQSQTCAMCRQELGWSSPPNIRKHGLALPQSRSPANSQCPNLGLPRHMRAQSVTAVNNNRALWSPDASFRVWGQSYKEPGSGLAYGPISCMKNITVYRLNLPSAGHTKLYNLFAKILVFLCFLILWWIEMHTKKGNWFELKCPL